MIRHGDCLDVLPTLDAESLDACVTDPPYGLAFMGKDWDNFTPGDTAMRRRPELDALNAGMSRQGGRQRACAGYQKRQARDMAAYQAWATEVFTEVLRVLKPGAHLLAFGGTRTYHRLACAIEDAGFEVRDCLMWIYGSGFPKSLDVGKAIDKEAGAKRERIRGVRSGVVATTYAQDAWSKEFKDSVLSSEAITDLARQWSGWGTALKPAYEPIILARKPLAGTVAANVARYGTGAINIDGCRVDGGERLAIDARARVTPSQLGAMGGSVAVGTTALGRWPANVLHDGSDEVVGAFPTLGKSAGGSRGASRGLLYGMGAIDEPQGYGDSGSAARFFYCAKASRSERERGLDDLNETRRTDGRETDIENPRLRTSARKNHHPTVKPLALMRYLVRLVTPPGGTVLDPFAGSGSTLVAAVEEGFRALGIERDAEYVEIAEARLRKRQPALEMLA